MEVTQLDLPIQDVERLRKVLNKHVPFKNVWAYGSRVKGTASKHSDLDMVVFGASEAQLYETREALEESNVPVEVQLFRWEDLPTNFHENIQQAYCVVQREADWCEMTLGDVLEIKYGKDHKALNEGNYPCLGSGGIMRFVDNFLYDEESILIPRKGTLNNIIYQDTPFWTVDTMFWSKIDQKKAIPKFLFYQLTLIDYNNLNVGSAVPSLTVSVINEIEITLPPLPEQRAIADVLSSLDAKIDLLHRQNQTLEALAETLFRQWFIEEANPDWEYSTIKQYVSTIDNRGKTPPNISEQTKYPIIEVNALGKNSRLIDYSLIRKYVTEDTFNTWFRGKPKKFSTLISTVGSIGFLSMYLLEVGNIAQNIICLEPKKISPFYLYQYLKFKTEDILNLDIGGVQPSIKVPHLLDLELLIPSREKLDAFDVHALAMVEKMETNYIQIQTLERLRDALLPKLMAGIVRVGHCGEGKV